MPGGDRSGPMGRGSRTGRGLGYCAGYDRPGRGQPGPGRGWGRGFGRGRGRGPPPDVVDPYYDDPYYVDRRPYYEDDRSRRLDTYGGDEKADLLNYVKDLEAELTAVKKRLEGLSAKKK